MLTKTAIYGCLLLQAVYALPPQQVVIQDAQRPGTAQKRPLHGRFLHITDFHPDSFYKVYTSTSKDAACHRGQGPAGIYGAETSECDSPVALINQTMKWVSEQFRDNIDFVLWTGDSARHDSDEENPRTQKEVLQLNSFMVEKMHEAFGKRHKEHDENPNDDFVVPIVPTFGNNDIMPHNIMVKGPNSWTRAYTNIWRQFIPEEQKHQFEQGGWFYVEVIPRKLAVFSLNTMYFFTNNAAVDGCAAHTEPGYRQMEWLRIQLQFLRDRKMKAIIVGHVPPVRQEAKALFDETCWQKYTLWLRQYRDVVVSSMYGHFNYDHFVLQDFQDIDRDTENGAIRSVSAAEKFKYTEDDVEAALSTDYFVQLRNQWSDLPTPPKVTKSEEEQATTWKAILMHSLRGQSKKGKQESKKDRKQREYYEEIGGRYAERFAASFCSASVVPNLLPTLRVFEYNVTGWELAGLQEPTTVEFEGLEFDDEPDVDAEKKKNKKRKKKYKFKIPEPPSHTAPPGPAYSPQTFSLLRYTQYFANLTHINNDFTADDANSTKWHEGKHKGKKPHDKDHKPNPKPFKFEPFYDTRDDDVYQLKDLTMPSLVDLAQRIGRFKPEKNSIDGDNVHVEKDKKKKRKKGRKGKKGDKEEHAKRNLPWYTFMRRAYVDTMDPQEIKDEFGRI